MTEDLDGLLAELVDDIGLVRANLLEEMDQRGLTDDRAFGALALDVEQIAGAAARAAALSVRLLVPGGPILVQPEVVHLRAAVAEMGAILRRTVGGDVDHLRTALITDLPRVMQKLGELTVGARGRLGRPEPGHRKRFGGLTPRELEVLGRVAAGVGNKAIALELGVRLNTVRNHVQSVLYKLDAHSKLEAVATAVREHLIAYPASGRRVATAQAPPGDRAPPPPDR